MIDDSSDDINRGMRAVIDSLTIPLYQIAENAGYDGLSIINKQNEQKENFGFDAKTGEWVDLFEAGIIDPTRVTRNAILNASSIASLLITSEAAIVNLKTRSEERRVGKECRYKWTPKD